MFTGIVECTGVLRRIQESPGLKRFVIHAPGIARGLTVGASLSVDGCCLTVTGADEQDLSFDLMLITLERTRLGSIGEGEKVNLERAMRVGDEIGGHFVQGHVDGVGEVTRLTQEGETRRVEFCLPRHLMKYIARTGSVSINGVSLTVADFHEDEIVVGIIPHTWAVTNFSNFKPGTRVNIEADVLAKYLERLLNEQGQEIMTSREHHVR